MALTQSKPLPFGVQAPNFNLPDAQDGKTKQLYDLKGQQATLVMFICNHCPYVIHINQALVKLANDYANLGVSFIAISSNDAAAYPADSFEIMKLHAKHESYPFPYLYDESQEVAKAYDAVCTPEFYLFDAELKLQYHGELDDSSPGKPEVPVTGNSLRTAIDALLKGEEVSKDQKHSMGCSIKWKAE